MSITRVLTVGLVTTTLSMALVDGRATDQTVPAPAPATPASSALDTHHGPLPETAEQRSGVSTSRQPSLPWLEPTPRGGPRVQGRYYHQEFLSVVTPPAFRRSALATGSGLSFDPGVGLGRLRSAWQDRKERKAQEEVTRELQKALGQ